MRSERLDRKPKPYTALSFAWLRRVREQREVPVLITRVDGFDVYYRVIRQNDYGLGVEQVIHSRTDALRPAAKDEFKLIIQKGPR